MNKNKKRSLYIFLGLILWGFFFVQKEFAFYGIYSLISYNLSEISSAIPYVCFIVTAIGIYVMIKGIIRDRSNKADKYFTALLIVLLLLQAGYFYTQSQKITITMPATVESVDSENNKITVVNTEDEDAKKVELYAPDLVTNMVEVDEKEYLVTYVCNQDNLYDGKLSMIQLIQEK